MLTIIFGIIKFLMPLVAPFIGKEVIDKILPAVAAGDTAKIHTLWVMIGLACGSLLCLSVATYFRSVFGTKTGATIQHEMRRGLFHHLQRLSMDFFARNYAGALASRVSSDIATAAQFVDRGIIMMIMDTVTILVLATILFLTNWKLTLLAMGLMGLSGLVVYIFGPLMRKRRREMQESQSLVTGRAAEYFAGISLVKASGAEDDTLESFAAQSAELKDAQERISRLDGLFQSLTMSLVMGTQIVIITVGAFMVMATPSTLTIGGLMLFLFYLRTIEGTVQRIVDGMLVLQDSMASLERIDEILHITPDPPEHPRAISPPLMGEVVFDQVTFGYNADRVVLKDFSWRFQAGRTYALVGPSGGGKSSVCRLLLRFYDPQAGTIRMDGHDLKLLKQEHFRSRAAIVLQEPILFSTSIRANIAFAADQPTQASIEQAARLAQAHDFIMALPDGYDTRLNERGSNLSGGQRQRISLARALMRDPCLLILDEATSALDSTTERSIQEAIDGLQGSRTIIVIAHRLSTVRNVDEIIVIDHGRIVETGTYDALCAQGGLFAQLIREQDLN
ncbi:MAG: ABC transporter ATP-binding protein [Phycisphaerae bacterium]